MGVFQFQVRLQGTTGLPKDVYENVLFYDVNLPDTVQGTCDSLKAKYIAANFLGGVNAVEVRAYELTGGQPVAASGPSAKSAVAVTWPHEVAICLSYATVDDVSQSTKRRRGRIYMGPLGGSMPPSDQLRPTATYRNTILDFGTGLASVGTAGNTTWKLFSRADQVAVKIESMWVDDSWDTQRRRGLSPTTRTTRDVQ